MSIPITIALTGLAGAGKDTVADTLVTHAGFSKIAFADALRLEVAAAFGLGDRYGVLSDRATKEHTSSLLTMTRCTDQDFVGCVAQIDGPRGGADFATRHYSPRQILQWWGTEYRRSTQPNYWSTKVALRIARMRHEGQQRVVVTDCRFDNEVMAVLLMGGEIWQVIRPGHPIVEGGHASQTDGSTFGPAAVLINDSSVDSLRYTTLRALERRHAIPSISNR